MTDERRKISVTEEQHTQLDWAFSIINEIMIKNDLAVLQSKKLKLVVSYLGDD